MLLEAVQEGLEAQGLLLGELLLVKGQLSSLIAVLLLVLAVLPVAAVSCTCCGCDLGVNLSSTGHGHAVDPSDEALRLGPGAAGQEVAQGLAHGVALACRSVGTCSTAEGNVHQSWVLCARMGLQGPSGGCNCPCPALCRIPVCWSASAGPSSTAEYLA